MYQSAFHIVSKWYYEDGDRNNNPRAQRGHMISEQSHNDHHKLYVGHMISEQSHNDHHKLHVYVGHIERMLLHMPF